VARLRARVERDGGRLLVLLMPTKEEVYLPLLGETAVRPSELVRARLEPLGVPVLDLGEALRARASRRGPALYFAVDGHPGPEGQAVLAEAVGSWLAGQVPRLAGEGPLAAR
jgi:hypothetical protein